MSTRNPKIRKRTPLDKQKLRMRKQGYVPVRDAAEAAGIGISTMYEWLDKKFVRGKRVGRSRYVSVSSLQDHLGDFKLKL